MKTLVILLLAVASVQCSSIKMDLTANPFTVNKANYQKFLGGAPGSDSGVYVNLDLQNIAEGVVIKQLFFEHLNAPVSTESTYTHVAKMIDVNTTKQDIILSNDPVEEAVNTPSKVLKSSFPFALPKNMIGVMYTLNGKKLYTIIKNPKMLKTIAYPSAPPKRDRGY